MQNTHFAFFFPVVCKNKTKPQHFSPTTKTHFPSINSLSLSHQSATCLQTHKYPHPLDMPWLCVHERQSWRRQSHEWAHIQRSNTLTLPSVSFSLSASLTHHRHAPFPVISVQRLSVYLEIGKCGKRFCDMYGHAHYWFIRLSKTKVNFWFNSLHRCTIAVCPK